MTVYVDDMRAKYGRMTMCHMIADTEAELHAMADAIGVDRRWYQKNASRPHYDISLGKRAKAVELGAVEVTWRQCACMSALKAFGLPMGDPSTAAERYLAAADERRAGRAVSGAAGKDA